MPQIPHYNGTQIAGDQLRPVYQNAPDVSSGTRALGNAVAGVGEALDTVVRRDEEATANKIDTDITAGWLKWDAENRRKYQGQNAGDYEAAATDWWNKAAEAHGKDLSPRVRQQIGMTLQRKRASALGTVSGYIGTEKERWADDQAEAAAHTTIDMGVDTGDTAGAADRVRQIVAEKAARKGWSTEQVQADQQRLLGTLHLSYVTQLAEKDATKAQEYYTANKGEIPASVQAKVEQVLKGEGDNQFADQFASQNAALPLADQLAKAAEIKDPERRKKVLGVVRENNALLKAAQVERESGAADEAWQLVGQGKRVPESVLVRMDGRARVQLQEHLADRARAANNREASTKTDWVTYIELREKLANGEDVDLRPFAGTKIAGPQMEQLLDIKGKGKADKDVASSAQQIGSYSKELKLPKDKQGMFESAAQTEFDTWKTAHGGKLPNFTERKKILDELLLERENEWYQFGTKRAFEMPAGERGATKLKDKPATVSARPASAVADLKNNPPVQSAGKYIPGKVYRDANGNRAVYQADGSWKPTQ